MNVAILKFNVTTLELNVATLELNVVTWGLNDATLESECRVIEDKSDDSCACQLRF